MNGKYKSEAAPIHAYIHTSIYYIQFNITFRDCKPNPSGILARSGWNFSDPEFPGLHFSYIRDFRLKKVNK